MYVRIIRVKDDYVLNMRHTDELLEDGTFKNEAECLAAEAALRKVGIWYLSADIYLRAGR